MASIFYNKAKKLIAEGTKDLKTASDIRAALLMTNTTADTENDALAAFLNGTPGVDSFTTLDECDATGYARIALTSEIVNQDDANDRAEFDADDLVFSGLSGDATRNIQGVLLYWHVTNDADSIPIAFVDFTLDIVKEATQITVPWDAEGILHLT